MEGGNITADRQYHSAISDVAYRHLYSSIGELYCFTAVYSPPQANPADQKRERILLAPYCYSISLVKLFGLPRFKWLTFSSFHLFQIVLWTHPFTAIFWYWFCTFSLESILYILLQCLLLGVIYQSLCNALKFYSFIWPIGLITFLLAWLNVWTFCPHENHSFDVKSDWLADYLVKTLKPSLTSLRLCTDCRTHAFLYGFWLVSSASCSFHRNQILLLSFCGYTAVEALQQIHRLLSVCQPMRFDFGICCKALTSSLEPSPLVLFKLFKL